MGRVARKAVGVYVSPHVDREVEHLSVDTGKTKSELYELGLRVLLELLRDGRLSAETSRRIEELREKLQAVASARN